MPALAKFREEVPPRIAADSSAVWTSDAWNEKSTDKSADGSQATNLHGSEADISAWTAVDERTMDPYYFLRMQRQSMRGKVTPKASSSNLAPPFGVRQMARNRLKNTCRITSARGQPKVDFREVGVLREFLDEHGKIVHRRRSGLSARAQRKMSRAVKTARHMALLHPEPKPGPSLEELREMEEREEREELLQSGTLQG